jgi:Ca-activated chloride channel homolog
VTGLTADRFKVYEDNEERPIVACSHEDAPCPVGVVFDLSGSMQNRMGAASAALRAFLDGAEPSDEGFLLTVSSRPETRSRFTSDFSSIQNSRIAAKTGGHTALIDTIYLGLSRLRRAQHGRRALLVISDGADNHSHYTEAEMMKLLDETDAQIYTIGVRSPELGKKAIEVSKESSGLCF